MVPSRMFFSAGVLACGLLAVGVPGTPALSQPTASQTSAFSLADLVERVAPAVVRVTVVGRAQVAENAVPPEMRGSPLEEFFRRFGGGGRGRGLGGPQPRQPMGQGSGFIIDPSGFVVTNNHVIGNAERVTVELADGRELPARVVGSDPQTDVALLRIEAGGALPTVSWGDSDQLRVGDPVLAMGNPFGLGGTATSGIVSARGRQIGAGPYDDFIQTDASINPGNSGGPLFNARGEVVGVNTAIFSPSGGNIGIGFAIPSQLARRVVEDLRDDGKVERGWLGVSLQPLDRELAQALGVEEGGALLASVEPGSPADRAGLKAGDVVTQAGDRPVRGPRDLSGAVATARPGSSLNLTVIRDGQRREQQVSLGTPPDRREVAARGGQQQPREQSTGALGLALGPRQGGGEGASVMRVAPDSAAAERGLQPGDVILRVGNQEIKGPGDFVAAIEAARQAGRPVVALQIQRGEATSFIALPLQRQG
ncbi:Do family serine endopeptidase [Sabulicella rubraurantiaca]|uniref:Do family serine endopeptidase n=1 Tax=Sabulicella rubraurantiaca TaxID=2811429 RepID=UPI001A971D14|nr:Do family serine endopeptidase [Sabulicella rubraurantiaca]